MSGLNRAELLKRLAAHRAAAGACEKALKAEAARIFEAEGSADTWRLPAGLVAVAVSHDRAVVVDDDAFIEWVAARFPTEVETVTVRRVRNAEWLKGILGQLAGVDIDELAPGEATMCMDDEGRVVPGAVFRRGGEFVSASITLDAALKRRFAAAAAEYVTGAPMPGIDPPPPPPAPPAEDAESRS